METATPGVKSTRDGWLNRYLQASAADPQSAARRRAWRGRCRASLQGTAPSLAVRRRRRVRRARRHGRAARRSRRAYRGADNPLLARHGAATRSRRCARCATHRRRPTGPRPASSIRARRSARRCRRSRASPRPTSASRSRSPSRATGITTSTKAARRDSSRSGSTISPRGIAALAADLGDRMADTVILTMSEFGRAVAENGNRGTDHGHGNAMMLIGGPVKGGSVYGTLARAAGRISASRGATSRSPPTSATSSARSSRATSALPADALGARASRATRRAQTLGLIRALTPQRPESTAQWRSEPRASVAVRAPRDIIAAMARKSTVAKAKCALCGAKDVSEPRGEERYCRDCWEKKIAVEEIVAREFALKRYIRAHSAEKYLIYHSTIKRPCGQIIVVDDGYDLFLTMVLYPNFGWDEAGLSPRRRPGRAHVRRDSRRRRRHRGHRAVGRRQVAPGDLPVRESRTRGLERRNVSAYNRAVAALLGGLIMNGQRQSLLAVAGVVLLVASVAAEQAKPAAPSRRDPRPSAPAMKGRPRPRKLVAPVRGVAPTRLHAAAGQAGSADFIVTTIKVKNMATAPIAGFKVDEFWYDKGGDPVTGDQTFRHPQAAAAGRGHRR